MSRFLSLCGQRRTCGRLTRILQWFDTNCHDDVAFGTDEVRLGKAVGMAGNVRFAAEVETTLCELERLRGNNERGTQDPVKIKGRALVCAGLLAQQNVEFARDLVKRFDEITFRFGSMSLHEAETIKRTNASSIDVFFQRASDMGDQCGMAIIGSRGIKENEVGQERGCELLQRAAGMGDTDAMVNLGFCYEKGHGVPQDKKKAIQLFRQATDMGNTNAMVQLGDCYMEGDGILRDKKKAIELYQQAADIGNVDAMSKLFNHYMVRGSVPRNKKKAIDSFQCAIDKGNTDAMVELGELFTKGGPGVPLDKKKAIELFQRAASLGNKCAILRIGRCYEEGYLVRPDIGKAIEWYQKAAKMG